MNKQKGFSGAQILILLAIILAGGGFYFYSTNISGVQTSQDKLPSNSSTTDVSSVNSTNTQITEEAKIRASISAKTHDARRLAHITDITSVLADFYDKHKTYPVSLNEAYGGSAPVAPTPADGNCTEEQNKYIYKKTSSSTYTLSFCLAITHTDFSAGYQILTEKGIKCTGDPAKKTSKYCTSF